MRVQMATEDKSASKRLSRGMILRRHLTYRNGVQNGLRTQPDRRQIDQAKKYK